MKIQTYQVMIVTALIVFTSSKDAFCVPKDMDVGKIMEKNSTVIKGMKKLGFNPITAGKELNESLEPKSTIGENVPRKCIDKERSLGNGIIKCKNGYFQEE